MSTNLSVSRSPSVIKSTSFRRMADAFCDQFDVDELCDLHRSLDTFIEEAENILSADEAFEMFFRSYPGWHSHEWEYNYNRFNRAVALSNAGTDTPRSAWERHSYELHSGRTA